MAKRLLLISNSRAHGQGYLDHCEPEVKDFLKGVKKLTFVPYAQPGGVSLDEYTNIVRERFQRMEMEVQSVHEMNNPRRDLLNAEAVFIGGGNTFLLLKQLYETGILEIIRRKAEEGMPYMGTSAGANAACPTIMTTNDMPIVYPPSFNALNLVPFQINPHYLDPDPDSKHQGETRETRIKEFHTLNAAPVAGLREGAWLRIEGATVTLKGTTGLRLFMQGKEPVEYKPVCEMNFLLQK
jgi:dipeptidase E